jgi:pantoate--beta-alanine ligase
MLILSDPQAMQGLALRWKRSGKSLGFIPTMGALHRGHLELVRASRRGNRATVVSIYVNPLQFGPKEDYSQYPRTLARDLDLLQKEKVQAVFTPSDREMYPAGFSTGVKVEGTVVRGLCAPFRPGHFEGVATVVVKLLGAVQPERLYLGQKDAQQAAVLKKVIRDLNLAVEPVVCPTVREHDGLAMSSRNQRLGLKERRAAPALFRALKVGKSLVDLGQTGSGKVLSEIRKVLRDERRIKLQYLEAVDGETLEPVGEIRKGTLLALAAMLGEVRLIDNLVI